MFSTEQYHKGIMRDYEKLPEHDRTVAFYKNQMSHISDAIVLDLGAGNGSVSLAMAQTSNVSNVIAYDINLDVMSKLREVISNEGITNIQLCCDGAPWELPFEAGSFDVVICRNAFHHFKKQRQTLEEIHRCLKNESLFFLSDAILPEHSRNTLRGICKVREDSFEDFFTYPELIDSLEGAGFFINLIRPYHYQHNSIDAYLESAPAELRSHLKRAWLGLDEKTMKEMKWTGNPSGHFITYYMFDVEAIKFREEMQ